MGILETIFSKMAKNFKCVGQKNFSENFKLSFRTPENKIDDATTQLLENSEIDLTDTPNATQGATTGSVPRKNLILINF